MTRYESHLRAEADEQHLRTIDFEENPVEDDPDAESGYDLLES